MRAQPGQPAPRLVLNYQAVTYHDISKNVESQPLRNALNAEDGKGEVIALRGERDSLARLQACGFDTALETPDEKLVLIIERMIARWNTHVAPLNTKIHRSPVSKNGGGCAHQAIPMKKMQTKGQIVFDEDDYSVAALFPVCYRTYTYIDKYRHQGIKQSKMLDDYIL